MKETIGVVGCGFVGTALIEGMKHAFDIETYDSHKESTCDDMIELVERCPVIFVCVPTPMKPSGESSTRIVHEVCANLSGIVSGVSNAKGQQIRKELTVVIKSTVPPGTTEKLQKKYGGGLPAGPFSSPSIFDPETLEARQKDIVHFVFNPEFLTEKNYIEDFKNQDRIVFGAATQYGDTVVRELYRKSYPNVTQLPMYSPAAAEMVKYTTNVFLATKVSLANELYQVCEAFDIDYRCMIAAAKYDDRLGLSHWLVPGPDGSFGFGLSCFPKDLNALMHVAREHGVNPRIMQAVWDKNLEVRPETERDWEKMTKAVVKGERMNFPQPTERVILESPFSAETPEEFEMNLRYMRACMRECFRRGWAPYASHAIYTQPGVLDDDDPHEREIGIHGGFLWAAIEVAKKRVFCMDLGMSRGMKYGKEDALKKGQEIIELYLPGWKG